MARYTTVKKNREQDMSTKKTEKKTTDAGATELDEQDLNEAEGGLGAHSGFFNKATPLLNKATPIVNKATPILSPGDLTNKIQKV